MYGSYWPMNKKISNVNTGGLPGDYEYVVQRIWREEGDMRTGTVVQIGDSDTKLAPIRNAYNNLLMEMPHFTFRLAKCIRLEDRLVPQEILFFRQGTI